MTDDSIPTPLTLTEADSVLESLSEREGTAALMWGTDARLKLHKLPLGLDPFDRALEGGLGLGRFSLFIGEWSSGKTLLASLAIKAAQARNLVTAVIDIERAWDMDWAAAVGVDPAKVMVARPSSGEAAFATLKGLCEARVGVVVLDSLAACVPEKLLDTESDPMAARARLFSQELPKVLAVNTTTAVILINQLRESPGVMFGNPETLPGGRAQRFYSHQLIRVRRKGWIEEGTKDKKRKLGFHMGIYVEKSKQGGVFQSAEIPFYFTGFLDEIGGMVPVAIELGVVQQNGGHYTLPDGSKIFGREKLVQAVRDSVELQDALRAGIDGAPGNL